MKIIFFLFFWLCSASFIFSDDGSWNVLFKEIRANIYSDTENNEIALEKEILKFGGLITPSVGSYFSI